MKNFSANLAFYPAPAFVFDLVAMESIRG